MGRWGQLGFMDASSPLMEEMIYFHDHAMMILVMIITLVGYAAVSFLFNKHSCRSSSDGQLIETVWTIIPAFILFFLALPSLRLLYLLDEVGDPQLTIKSVGHQWYWSYEYDNFEGIQFDSYMVPTTDLELGDFRLLEVDNRVVFPVDTEIRVLVTSMDVIHSWTVPSLGIKADAVPGRLNQLAFTGKYPGVFYGQCSEICGANHSFMPIVLEGILHESFVEWLYESDSA
uniref:Cytochrome c oxidase subunit 2 n=1 Tax=Thylacodes squamigerus TaxID=766170 RepID=E2FLV6_9CAEN|nr:cytochrome c oxidase subunit II [Thylacodes squamigerus]ADI79422.1 cytochrome c oxidase subunit 2 [Thylacodes squamigerus]